MIGWVHEYCKEWGRAKRYVLSDAGAWPTRTMLGKLMDEGVCGAGQSGPDRNHFPEVMEGRALEVNTALKRMANTHRMYSECMVIWAHYVLDGLAKSKAKRLEMSRDDYWRFLNAGHSFIAAHFPEAPELIDKSVATFNTRPLSKSNCL